MSYQVLARKWRPHSLKDMVGQPHVLRMLTNALDNQRLHHAYLYAGTRGVGKTSLARIFAKCLNCEKGISSQPCDECSICRSIDEGRFVDLIEIDAASRTKVEDTRELLDNVQYAPTQGRFKIYLIDEVHMLSGHSFNALLKTLEEPPAHVKFLLATTDPKRLPITILSRCLQFNLKRITQEDIAKHLSFICTSEKIEFDPEALQLLANAADGSVRDALSLLDQAIAYCNQKIALPETRQMLGYIEQDSIFQILLALSKQDGKELFAHIEQLAESAPDYQQVLSELISTLHQVALTQRIPDLKNQPDTLIQLAKLFSPEEIQLYYQIALIGKRDLPLAPHPAQGFEMLMLRLLAFKPIDGEQPDKPVKQSVTTKTPAAPIIPSATISTDPLNWSELLNQLQLTGVAYALASNCSLIHLENTKAELALSAQHQALLNKRLVERIEQALSNHFGKTMSVEIKISTDEIQTPSKKQQVELTQKQATAKDSIKNDTHVQKILDVFEATLDESSIKAF